MKKLLLVLVLVVAGVAVPAGSAGGWATVGLSSLPDGTAAGETWSTELTVLQHGRTPLEGIAPVLTIRNGNGDSRRFIGSATGRPGVYRIEVVFPGSGTWSYEVWDDFSRTHTFTPVEIGTPAGESFPTLPLAAGILLALAGAGALLLFLRRAGRAVDFVRLKKVM